MQIWSEISTHVWIFLGNAELRDREGKRVRRHNKKMRLFTHFLTHKSTLLSTKPKAQNAQSWRVLYKRAHITYCIRHVSYNFPSGKYTNDFKSYFLDGFQVFISPILLDRDAYAFNARARSSPHDSPGRRRDVDLHLDKRLGAA